MNETLLISAIVTGLVSFLVVRKLFSRDPTKLTEFKSQKGKYTALFPDAPQETSQKVNTPEGRIDLHLAQAKSRYHQFIVAYCDYPQHVVDAKFPKDMLDGSRDGAVKNIHGELLSETVFDFHGYEGRELHIKVNPKAAMRMRMMLIDRRLYQLQAICASDNVWSKKVGDFFEGFKVTK